MGNERSISRYRIGEGRIGIKGVPETIRSNSIKAHLYKLFREVGSRHCAEVVFADFKPRSVAVVISQLKSRKYTPSAPLLFIEKDGKDFVRRA